MLQIGGFLREKVSNNKCCLNVNYQQFVLDIVLSILQVDLFKYYGNCMNYAMLLFIFYKGGN